MSIKHEPGWHGAFTRDEVLGALRNGTRIVKVASEPGDTNPNGTKGTVLGSMVHEGVLAYFIEWDTSPKVAVGCMSYKVMPDGV